MSFAKLIKRERKKRKLKRYKFADDLNISSRSLTDWEDGLTQPSRRTIVRIGQKLNWSDKLMLELIYQSNPVDEITPYTNLSNRVLTEGYKSGLTMAQIARRSAVKESNLSNWVNGQETPSANSRQLLVRFLKEEIESITDVDVKPPKGNRIRATEMTLIQKIEAEHGSLDKCPEDDPTLIVLRKRLGEKA